MKSANGSSVSVCAWSDVNLLEYHTLRLELQRYRDENTRLRKAMRLNATSTRISDRAYMDAMAFTAEILADRDVSRLAMRSMHGMTRRRWEWARALCRLAGITDGYYQLTARQPDVIEAALREARDLARQDLAQLKRYLPRCRSRELS